MKNMEESQGDQVYKGVIEMDDDDMFKHKLKIQSLREKSMVKW